MYILSGQTYTVSIDSTFIPDQNYTTVSIRGGLGASASAASIISGQLSTAVYSILRIRTNNDSGKKKGISFFLVHQKNLLIVRPAASTSVSTASTSVSTASTAVSTPVPKDNPDQNSPAVSIRGGLGASASAASILPGQVSTAKNQEKKQC